MGKSHDVAAGRHTAAACTRQEGEERKNRRRRKTKKQTHGVEFNSIAPYSSTHCCFLGPISYVHWRRIVASQKRATDGRVIIHESASL